MSEDAWKSLEEPITYSEIRRRIRKELRKQELGVDYYLNELKGKMITITDIDLSTGVITASLDDGRTVKIFTNSRVVLKKLVDIVKSWDELKKKIGVRPPVLCRVVERISRSTGNRYIDIE